MWENPDDWQADIIRPSIRRDITEDDAKVAVVLNNLIKQLVNSRNHNIKIENIDGQYIITLSDKLNALEVKVQNPLEHYNEDASSNALKEIYQFNYSRYMPEFYINLAKETMESYSRSGAEISRYHELTPENLLNFACWLHDSDSLSEAIGDSACNELDYYAQVQEEDER